MMKTCSKPSLFILLSVIVLSLSFPLYSQGIKGSVVDIEGDPVAYASIFIRELTRGTTSNANGDFSLPLPPGSYTIFFRSLGYTEVQKTINVGEGMTDLKIVLPPQTYMIPEVRVVASGEDPAYAVMRKVIGLASYHLNVIKSYNAEIYIKGTALFDNIPRALSKKIAINDVPLQEDKVYMLESLNEVTFIAPDKYDMKIVASQNTIPGYTDNVNPMNYINASLYQPEVQGVISPLARNAFFHYNFTFEGSYLEGILMIDKIRVTPKRKSQQMWEGTIYVVEDLWCLHTTDLSVETIAGTISLRQLYANVMMDAWLPVNHKIVASIDMVGVEASVTYVSSLKYSDVILNANLPKSYFEPQKKPVQTAAKEPEKQPTKEETQINELLAKDDLNNRDMAKLTKLMEKQADESNGTGASLEVSGTNFIVERNAVKNDSVYWNAIRPVPLTPAELTTLKSRDSIAGIRPQRQPLTGQNQLTIGVGAGSKSGKPGALRGVILGKTYKNRTRLASFTWGGLVNPSYLGFNTVDGWNYRQELRINWKMDTVHVFRSHLMAGYAFNRKAPMITWNNNILYAPLRRGKISLNLKYNSQDFNGTSGMPAGTNMIYSLFLRMNPVKYYEFLDINFQNRIDLFNGLVLDFYADLARRNPLSNTNEFSFFFRNSRDYDFNLPGSLAENDPVLARSDLFGLNIFLEYTPGYYYEIRNNRKEMLETGWPTFYLNYRNAIPLGSSGWADFNFLAAGIRQRAETGLLSHINWSAEYGIFVSKNSLHFSDYKHFKSVMLPVDMQDFTNAFMLLDPYTAATSDWYFEGHFRFETAYLALKFLPFLSDKVWTESLQANYLRTPGINHHIELGYSMNSLFLYMVDAGIFVGFDNWKFIGPGIRINLRF
ncbi:MAG: DUF5686 and carboxypeptidase regulatory-like domain-containing protein [Bacteroidota bacterium]